MSETVRGLIEMATIKCVAELTENQGIKPSNPLISELLAWPDKVQEFFNIAVPGLWDAKIVEGDVKIVGPLSDDTYAAKIVSKDHMQVFVLPKPGNYVRIIVLPVEEKEDDSR